MFTNCYGDGCSTCMSNFHRFQLISKNFHSFYNWTDPSLSPRGCVRIKVTASFLLLLPLLLMFLLLLETILEPLGVASD